MTFELSSFLATNKLALLGLLSGLLSIIAFVPYVIDILRQTTQPDRASWLIWSALGSISFMSQLHGGATASLWFVGVQVSGTVLVSVLSIWYGAGRYLSFRSKVLFAIAMAGLVSWYLVDTPIYAMLISIGISLLGGAVTVIKAYRAPASETLSTWIIALLASVCAVASVSEPSLIMLAYPLYLLTLYTAIVLAIIVARGRFAPPKPTVVRVKGYSLDHVA